MAGGSKSKRGETGSPPRPRSRDPRTRGLLAIGAAAASVVALVVLRTSGAQLRALRTMDLQIVPVLLAASALLLAQRRDWVRWTATAALVLSLVVPALASPALPLGDHPEYYTPQISMIRHGTPDRQAQDTAAYLAEARREGLGPATGVGFFTTTSGGTYPYHFWLTSAVTVPFGIVLKVVGLSPLRAFALVNGLLIALAFYGLLFWSGFDARTRSVFAAFWILSPVTWYLAWPSAEVWSASLVVLAIVLYSRGRFGWAVALASLAATQNQPILAFSTLLAVAGGYKLVKETGAKSVLPVAGAWLLGLLPMLFYYVTFGTPNLIASNGEAGLRFITLQKVLGTYIDLNQGMAVYLPGLLVLWVGTVVLAARRRAAFPLLLAGSAVAMATLSAMTPNWNSGAVGLMRYAVWQMPVLVWGVLEILRPDRTWERRTTVALAGSQLAIALLVLAWPAYAPDFLHMGPIAAFVLDNRPALYSPDPDIFWDRTQHFEINDSIRNASGEINRTIGFAGPDHLFRKMLVLEPNVPEAAARLGISEEQFREDSYSAGRAGMWYIDLYPPR